MTTTQHPVETEDRLERPPWLPAQRWPFALRRYNHQRPGQEPLTIHVTDEGDGPVLVFVHAGMWSFIWRDAIVRLRSAFRCISLDFPGAGLSDGQPSDIDLERFPSIVNGLLDHLAVDSATLVIHDLGGVVGINAAAQRPERIEGLVATNSFAWPPDGRALSTMLGIMGSRSTIGVLGTLRTIPRLTRTSSGVGRHYDRGDRDAFFGPYRSRTRSRNFHRAMGSARRSMAAFEAAELALGTTLAQLPVLTVFGEKNDPFGFGDRWQGFYPAATSWIVPGGNHFPMCDDPDGYAEHLLAWHRREVAP